MQSRELAIAKAVCQTLREEQGGKNWADLSFLLQKGLTAVYIGEVIKL